MSRRKNVVNCDANPVVPDGWTVEEHVKGGKFEFDPAKIALYFAKEQHNGGVISSSKLRKKLRGRLVLNANLLDFLLAHPNLIPKKWEGKAIFFWGTIYRDSDGGLYVRYLFLGNGRWYCRHYWLGLKFNDHSPAAIARPPKAVA